MKRRLVIVAVFLLAGAVVNVAVAWVVAWRWQTGKLVESDQVIGLLSDPAALDLARWQGVVHTPLPSRAMVWEWSTVGVNERRMRTGPPGHTVRLLDFGWPARCVRMEAWRARKVPTPRVLPPYEFNGWTVTDGVILPFRPAWIGLAANTAFYAGALWVAAVALVRLRRTRRRRRGLCPTCAYPIGTTGVCSECGAKLPTWPLSESQRAELDRRLEVYREGADSDRDSSWDAVKAGIQRAR